MENKDKSFTLKIGGKEIEVSEEIYRAYIRPVRSEQRQKRREWKCVLMSEKGRHYVRCKKQRDVWEVSTNTYRLDEHFAMFPEKLIEPCILAGSKKEDTVLDPFFGSGTTGAVAKRLGREYIGIELNPKYCKKAEERIEKLERRRSVECCKQRKK